MKLVKLDQNRSKRSVKINENREDVPEVTQDGVETSVEEELVNLSIEVSPTSSKKKEN